MAPRVVAPRLTEEEKELLESLKHLDEDERRAVVNLAAFFSEAEKRRSLYNLVEIHKEISTVVATQGHVVWLAKAIGFAGAVAGVFLSIYSAWSLFGGK